MYLMYVDESGDTGLVNSPTRYFTLSGIVFHEFQWNECLAQLVEFRKRMRVKFGLLMREEIHAGVMFSKPGPLARIPRNDHLTIVRHFLDEIASLPQINIINVVVDKSTKPVGYNVFEMSWRTLIQRFENTLGYQNFPGSPNDDDQGMVFCDETDQSALRNLYRRMRVYNPVSNIQLEYGAGYRQLPLSKIVEDPNLRTSHHSCFVQCADAAAFALYQLQAPSKYIRNKGARNYFNRLDGVLCKLAARTDPQGIVRI